MNEIQTSTAVLQGIIGDCPQLDLKVNHYFAPGVYVRELLIPEGVVLVGKTHKTEHLNTLLMGECMVFMNGKTEHILAPHTFVSKAGVKKVITALKPSIWSTTHPTDETDLDKIEALIIDEEAEEEIQQFIETDYKLSLQEN